MNEDGYVSTGQGINSYNMFAYCGNNPVNRMDATGQWWIALAVGAVALFSSVILTGCAQPEEKALPYKTADDAAKGFSESTHSASMYIRYEYGTEIYSKTINGITTYDYNTPRAGRPHNFAVGAPIPKGTKLVAYAHTHPNTDDFSPDDEEVSRNFSINAYVVGPSRELKKYNLQDGATSSLGYITPQELTSSQQSSLLSDFRLLWDAHASTCAHCQNLAWPAY